VRSVLIAARGKGVTRAMRRAGAIATRYGIGPERMDQRIERMVQLLAPFDCAPTLPITASVAARNRSVVEDFAARGVEFAVHGNHHVDHTDLPPGVLRRELARARDALQSSGVATPGFRAPYLRADETTLAAVHETGFDFDSSQAMHWPLAGVEPPAYRRALEFYGSISAADHAVLPSTVGGLVRIPYCLPDDEAVVDRLRLEPTEISRLWLHVFHQTYERGELLALGVHPERIDACALAIREVLSAAHAKDPPVWIARLGEIARWWRERTATGVSARWPHGARACVAVTGDIDALTISDYTRRLRSHPA
jgi:peptidoglycan/xylan/chitin deacetylase (PgdA/CDA1 family)